MPPEKESDIHPVPVPLSEPQPRRTQRMLFQGPHSPHSVDHATHAFQLGPGETLVEISMATICGSDLHTYQGRRDCPVPAVLGHEGLGKVVQVGDGQDRSLLGQRVTWTLTDSCGACAACSQWQLPQKCESLFKYGHAQASNSQDFSGCFASHMILKAGTAIFPVPEQVPDKIACPANCALATMVAVTESLSDDHQTILIQGAGLLGVYGAALLQTQAKRVFITDPDPSRSALAEAFGATPFTQQLPENSIDAVIEVAGTSAVISEGLRVLRPGGFYALAGLVHPDSVLDLTGEQLIRKCLTVRGFHNYASRHLASGLHFLESNRTVFPWETLVSDPLPLSALDQAFELAAARRWHRVAVSPLLT